MNIANTYPSTKTTLFQAFASQCRVIGALIMRDIHSRYGRENIGYLWVIGEPMIFASAITLIHLTESTHYSSDIQPAPFAIIGYTIYIIFRNTFNRAAGAIENDQSLLYHRTITIFDVLISRIILEVAGCFTTIVILLTLAIMAGYAQVPARPLYLLGAGALMVWWTFGLTFIAASLTYKSETLARQLHVISYFSIPISGAFFQLQWLPATLRDKLEWFPMTLIFEQARYGQFGAASAEFVDPAYVSAWCGGLTYLGLLLVRRARYKING